MSPPPGDEEAGLTNVSSHLPSALEEVLAFKEYRAKELGVEDEGINQLGMQIEIWQKI